MRSRIASLATGCPPSLLLAHHVFAWDGHACSTLNAADPTAVVDDQLRVRGIERLRVIDAAIMPATLSADLNAATMMIAEMGADLVLGKPALEPMIVPEVV